MSTIECALCRGKGELDDAAISRIALGRKLSKLRVDAGLSLREFATRIGLKAGVLSDYEHGRLPVPAEHRALYEELAGTTVLDE